MLDNQKLLGFKALSNQQYNQLVVAKALVTEVQAKIGSTKPKHSAQ
ncbi:hypothetical protein [Synechocystis sp. LKSZ1]